MITGESAKLERTGSQLGVGLKSAGGASRILRLKPSLSRFLWPGIVIPFLKGSPVIFDRYRTVIEFVS